MRFAGPLLLTLGLLSTPAFAEPLTLKVWHSYRDAEEQALEDLARRFEAENPEIRVDLLGNPHDGYDSKLATAIPNDNGPDAFIFAHDRVGGWAKEGLIAPLDERVGEYGWSEYLPETVRPLRFSNQTWGLPLAFKSCALFYNRQLVPVPPRTTDELVAIAEKHTGDGRFGLAYLTGDFFMHGAWHIGFGGVVLDAAGRTDFNAPGSVAALTFVADLARRGLVPEEPTGALVTQLFNEGKAAMAISGPWLLGELKPGLDYGVAPLPIVSATGLPASPFLTTEAMFISARTKAFDESLAFARFVAGKEGALTRAVKGRQLVAHRGAWEDPRLAHDPVIEAFRTQLATATPTDNRPEMRNLWEPAQLALKKTLRQEATPTQAAFAAQRRYEAIARPAPPKADSTPYVVVLIALAIVALLLAGRAAWAVFKRGDGAPAVLGATWVAPAMGATFVLIFVPFAIGLVLSLFHYHEGDWTFVGLANFVDIVTARSFAPSEPLSFYYALVVTIAWTVVNLSLHVGIGLSLALLLNRPTLQLKPLYRVLLIIPWAVPNYITALLWKGLFHKQFGAINGLLELLGLERVAWFSSFGTAFFANVCANAWLGFPFMMVVCLGALQSIPRDLYEAADVDGASSWSKFRHVTAPLLMPALIPAVLLGMVWTFNQFNVVFLVSGGEPDNSTDILISEAYRWAFTRQEQYGYAAAYAALIFLILLGWSALSQRLARRAESMR